MKKLICLVLASVIVFTSGLFAQGLLSEGKDFYLGYIRPSFNTVVPTHSAGFFRVYAIISSFQDNTAYVSYFNEDGTEQPATPYKIQKRKSQIVVLQTFPLKGTDETKGYNSVHITAKKPINVQYYSTGASSGGMYLCLPTNVLGTKYVVSSYRDNPAGQGAYLGGNGPTIADSSRGFYQIIGTQQGTMVTITNNVVTTTGKTKQLPYTISLNRGQCYTVRSNASSSSDDISGSIIESDKPIVVIAGHENAQLGGVDGKLVEQRDYMVEQMVPYMFWDKTGHIVVPMPEGAGIAEGKGDNVRINVFKDTLTVTPHIPTSGIPITANSQVKTYETLEYHAVQFPSSFAAEDNISVVQYEMASHGSSAPFTRPSMMTIVPRSRWRNAYLGHSPSTLNENASRNYLTLIAPKSGFDSIYYSKNGQKDVPIGQAGLTKVAEYLTIPNHPDLKAVCYLITNSSYYLRGRFPFMAYCYGYTGISPDGDLGNFDGDDFYWSYASPLGMNLANTDTSMMVITVDTLCSTFEVCVTDLHPGGVIRSAILVDDPEKDIFVPPAGHGPYVHYNTSFTPDLDPNNTGEITFLGDQSQVCFEVNVSNVFKDGYAPILISDNRGNSKLIELYYKRRMIVSVPSVDSLIYFGDFYNSSIKDSTFIFVNQAASATSYTVSEAALIKDNPAFEILSVTPPLPAVLAPGDSLSVLVRFTSIDTGDFADSLLLKTDCLSIYWSLSGKVGTGLIVVSDHDFNNYGTVPVGDTRCTDTITIRNVGYLPFLLTKNWALSDTVHFSFDPKRVRVGSREYELPVVIPPGGFVKVVACYTPTDEGYDSATLTFATDIGEPYTSSIKTYSLLRGRGVKPDVRWNIDTFMIRADSAKTQTFRHYLVNNSTAPIVVDSVYLAGPDADEFQIIEFQDLPEIGIDIGDSVWVDFSYTPNLTKPRDHIRRARVVATTRYDPGKPDILEFVAGFNIVHVKEELQLESFSIYPNPTHGQDITVSFGLTEPKELGFVLYDMLGREVLAVPSSYYAKGKQSVMLSVSKLSEGGYILRVSDGVLTKSISLRVGAH